MVPRRALNVLLQTLQRERCRLLSWMTMVPWSCWPLAEHARFGQNGFGASLGSMFVCINDSMPMDACFFKPPCSFHRLVESYREPAHIINWKQECKGNPRKGYNDGSSGRA